MLTCNRLRTQVVVESDEPSDLQLGVDESYELSLGELQTGVLRAKTEWGT